MKDNIWFYRKINRVNCKGGKRLDKESIIQEKRDLVYWVLSLNNISNDLWMEPFREGSWAIADVISHFISWDKFIINNRVSYVLRDECFPNVTVDVEFINKEASKYARSGILKDNLIKEFISVREELLNLIDIIPKEKFYQPLLGRGSTTLSEYFEGLIEHDLKHREQIDLHISNY